MGNRKAFTLIELLAVIVILAIIALIAVPVIMNILNKANKSAFKDTAYGVINAAELYYAEQQLELNGMSGTVEFTFPNDIDGLEIKGNLPEQGSMKITEEGYIALAISNGRYCIRKGYKENDVVFDMDVEDCYIYREKYQYSDHEHEIIPEVKTGTIPVIIENDGTVKKSHTTSKWHNYKEKMWANVVTVTEETREKYMNADIGTEIKEEDILTYFVWIPRYKYKLWYVEAINGNTEIDTSKVHSIDIVFEDKEMEKSNGDENGEYLTHPAFTFGEEELNGIWVGKFETGYNGTGETNVVEPTKPIIKPNVSPWMYIDASNIFYTVYGMKDKGNVYGFSDDSDTHMMKNTEWGAVAYLSHSQYGTCDNGVCHGVYKNITGKTGCGGNTVDEAWSKTCINGYGTLADGKYYQSTNKNITGIFDMNGGNDEMMMTMGVNSAAVDYAKSGFTQATFPEDKYVDMYKTSGVWAYSYRILGDATGEMGPFNSGYYNSWYQEYSAFTVNSSPCFARGGGIYNDKTGIFRFRYSDCNSAGAFRIVIV